jgi:hypothetical protein
MKKIIHHLRRQPEEVRTHILHILTVSATVVLMLLWVYSLGTTISNPQTVTQTKQDLQPFSVLKDNLVGGYQSMSQNNQSNQTAQPNQQSAQPADPYGPYGKN